MPYLEERFEAAVSILVGDGSVKDRLVVAYLENLDDLESDELPQSLRKRFEDLHTALHAVTPIGREPRVRAATRKMSNLQAGNHARTILSLYVDRVCHGKHAKPLRVTSPTPKSSAYTPHNH